MERDIRWGGANPSDVGGQGLDFAFFCTAVCESRQYVFSVKLV